MLLLFNRDFGEFTFGSEVKRFWHKYVSSVEGIRENLRPRFSFLESIGRCLGQLFIDKEIEFTVQVNFFSFNHF
jgi:hypothetical protein